MKRLYRSKEDRKISGVCGGLGEYFNVDSNILRIAWVLIGLATGVLPSLIAYIVALILLPSGKQ